MKQFATAFVLGGLFAALLPNSVPASAQSPTAGEILTRVVEKNAQRQAILQHYATDRTYTLEYTGIGGEHHAQMIVHAEYDAPGHKHLTITSESGSKPLCHEVLRKLVDNEQETANRENWQREMFSPETYDAQLLGLEQLDGHPTYVLNVEPKVNSKITYRGKVWISTDDYAIVRLQGEPTKNPSWMLNHATFDTWYMRRGEVWVPEKNISISHVRLGGEAHVTIDYGQYTVLNTSPMNATTTNLPPVNHTAFFKTATSFR